MKKLIATIVMFAPTAVFAQTNAPVRDFNSLTVKATSIGNTIIGILIALAVIFIIYNVLMFIVKASDPEGRKAYQSAILWGIVGLAVILSIWGLVAILTNTFGTTTGGQGPVQEYPVNPIPPTVQ